MIQSINEFLTEDHRHLDELLEDFQECKHTDPAKARDLLAQLATGLYRHLQWEETILFPFLNERWAKPV